MYRLLNKGNRAFIVKESSVLKGGEKITASKDVAINAQSTVEVTEECGEFLKSYSDIRVLEHVIEKKGKSNAKPEVATISK